MALPRRSVDSGSACAGTLFLVIAAFLIQPTTGLGGWRCDACQDVVTTFRLQFPELGARDMGAPISAGGADPEAVVAPAPPGCTAFAKGSTIRSACVGSRQGISVEERTRFFVWSSAKAGKAALEVCAELGKCKKLPPIGPTGIREAKTSDDEAAVKCDRASRTARCQLDPNCPAYKAAGCDEVCVSCLWLVQSWPRFSNMCAMEKKGGASSSSSASSALKKPGAARFAESGAAAGSVALSAAERIAQKRALAAQARAAAAEDAQLRAEEAEAAAELRAAEEEWHQQLEQEGAADSESGSGSAGASADEDEVLQTSAALLQVGEAASEGIGASAVGGFPSRSTGSSSSSSAAAAAAPAPAPIQLSDSTFRSTIKPAIIPKGLGSPALESSLLTLPAPDADELGDECMRQFWALASLPEAWSAVATGGADSHLAGYSWDPLTACRCMSKCPYNSIDALAVEEACGGIFEPRAPHLAGKRLLAGLARLKRARAPKAFAAAAGPGEAGELAGRIDTDISSARDV